MSSPRQTVGLKPTQKPIRNYYETLRNYRAHGIRHEGALETAFQRLLADTAQRIGWTLNPKQPFRLNGTSIVPDGTLLDSFNFPRGYWEAKDPDDNLETEIRKKTTKGYPLTNIIFEDTQQAVLFQDRQEALRIDLADASKLADLLNQFFAWTKPEYAKFTRAVEDFKDRIPVLARELADKIRQAHKDNAKFRSVFENFFGLCQNSLNPNIRQDAVGEMLVQHLLTERVIRKTLDDPEFMRRNVIAVEVEKVIAALVSKTFSRDEFQKSLAPFYAAIEGAARTIPEFRDKQHFLGTVYERFFQGYSVKLADTHGIVYTPQAIVDFMCASVEDVLREEFGLALGSPGVTIIDPCTGTGNFVMNLIRRVPGRDLPRVYREQLFANEVMLLPYYIAALNIEHTYYERTGEYEAFEGLCFVDTLDLAREKGTFDFTEKNSERVERQKRTPITVIIGNPPYNVGQLNENDNNKNRKYPVIEKRVRETYARDSAATNKNALWDAYVKFFRWAVDRLQGSDGIVCLVTNNSFVDQIAFDGMRKHLMKDFTRIYHLHLEGNVRHNPKLAGTTYNVFGIQVGVGITVAVRSAKQTDPGIFFARVDKLLRKEEKLLLLEKLKDIKGVEWKRIAPDSRHVWLTPEHAGEYASFLPIGSKGAKGASEANPRTLFKMYGRGVATCRDEVVYDFDSSLLAQRLHQFSEDYNAEVDRFKRDGSSKMSVDVFIRYDKVKWSESLKANLVRGRYASFTQSRVREALYRPFCKRFLFFDDLLNERRYQFPCIFPTPTTEQQNQVIALTDLGSEKPFMVLATSLLTDMHIVGAGASAQCFPFYTYAEDGTNRRENITDWALQQFRDHYGDKTIGKWDIFYYVYGLLHHPDYRERFADNLKRDLPRIPFAPNFRAFAVAGQELAQLHLDYEKQEPYTLDWLETPAVPLSYRVEDKMRLSKDKTALRVNPSLTLASIPKETFEYRLGNRSALEWVIDQYQVSEDKRSGIRSDPNQADDMEYIVRLVGQVVQVSLKTLAIIDQLPDEFA